MSLLTIVQNVCAELGLDQPSLVMSSSDKTVIQMRMLAFRAGYELANEHDWSTLMKQRTFTTTGTYPEPAEPPSDFERFTVNSVIWNNSRLWQLNGPVDAKTWERNTVINTNPVPQIWRMIGTTGNLDIYPNTVGETLSYEYVSNAWVKTATGYSSTWTQDSDYTVFPDPLMELSVLWRWKRAKGLDFGAELDGYKMAKESEIASDRAATPMSLSMPNRGNVPSTYWPGIISVTP